jgi:hypothetical protein
MKLSKIPASYFWSAESGMTSLLWFLVIYLFVVCGLGDLPLGDLVANLVFSLIIVAGVFTTFKQRWVRSLAVVLAVACLALTWEQKFLPQVSLTLLQTGLRLIITGFLLAVLIVQVFGAGPVTFHRIRGAIVVYLLLGGVWSFIYYITALTIPGSFHWLDGLPPGNPATLQRTLTYFSYTTLTTTGFGDITPIHPLTRTLAMFEALAGQLYLVITLARLVSLATAGQKNDGPNKSD